MNVTEAIESRRSIRGFKKTPVPDDVIQTIFAAAQQAPSNCNTQPWQVTVVSGEARDRLVAEFMQELLAGKQPTPQFTPGNHKLTGVYREREIDCAVRYYQTMGIAREDRDARNALSARNWQFFDAPHVAFMSMPLSMSPVNSVDVGIYLQSLMLLMVEYGLGSCPQGALAFFPDPVRKIANIPDDMGILCGLSFGYPDEEAVANSLKMPRAPLADSVEFIAD